MNIIPIRGFRQSRLVVSSFYPPAFYGFYVKLYANPVSSDLVLEASAEIPVKLNFCIYNLIGKILPSRLVMVQNELIKMGDSARSVYLVNVYSSERD